MFETLLNWVADTFARNDIYDTNFVLTDLTDADGEYYERQRPLVSHYDAAAAGSNPYTGDDTPMGKTVI